MEFITSQFVVALYHQTRAYESTRHLDVACGSGLGALMLTSMVKSPGYLLVTSEISRKKLELMEQRFINAGFLSGENSHLTYLSEIQSPLTFSDKPRGIHVRSYIANNEQLPFASEQFNSYTANLSLMLVDNPMNQLKEAHRVLCTDGIAGFTVWGRKENCALFTLISEAGASSISYFKLGLDKQKLTEEALEAGFKKAVTYYVPSHANFKDGEEAYALLIQNPRFKQVCKEKRVKEKFMKLYEDYEQEKGGLGLDFEVLYLIAYK